MKAIEAKAGEKYLSKTGVPVTVLGVKGDKVAVRLETIGKEIGISKTEELRPYDEKQISKDARLIMKANGKGKKGGKAKAKKEGSLASIIDPLLFEGKHTVKEIAAELAKKAGEAAKNKYLEANCRARLLMWRVFPPIHIVVGFRGP